MQARDCKQRVLRLKQWRVDNAKTVEQCIELCKGVPSDGTIKSVFRINSENKTFRETTLAAIELALLGAVYNPQITIPVEAAIHAQEAVVRPLLKANEEKSEEIKVRDRLIAVLLLFDAAILIFDLSIKTGGFFNSKTAVVWVIEALVVSAVAAILLIYKKRKKGAQDEV
jgi:hypothetical protein